MYFPQTWRKYKSILHLILYIELSLLMIRKINCVYIGEKKFKIYNQNVEENYCLVNDPLYYITNI